MDRNLDVLVTRLLDTIDKSIEANRFSLESGFAKTFDEYIKYSTTIMILKNIRTTILAERKRIETQALEQ